MTLKYTTVREFWKFLGANRSLMDYDSQQIPEREIVSTGGLAGSFFLKNMAVNPDTLIIYKGDTNTALTLTTDYTFDATTGVLLITAAGAVVLAGSDAKAVYEYCGLGKYFLYADATTLLERMEAKLEEDCMTVFADQAAANPLYNQITNESGAGQGYTGNIYYTGRYPLAKLQTTVASTFTLGQTSLVLVSAAGFPSSGAIVADGNLVVYTAKSSNTLTVPITTPSMAIGDIVRGEVVMVSTTPQGLEPAFIVLDPATDYSIDYDVGAIQVYDSYWYGGYEGLTRPQDGTLDRIRFDYMQAYHAPGKDCALPTELPEIIYMVAARQLTTRTIFKSNITAADNFDPIALARMDVAIDKFTSSYVCQRTSKI